MVAATTAQGLGFYSNGLLTVLAPSGWACSALVAADGGQRLDAYPASSQPAGSAPLSDSGAPPGTPVVQVDADYTGHGPGAQLVCPFFPGSPAATFLQGNPPCPSLPKGELTSPLTRDIVTFQDPPGVRGTGAGSGGSLASSGAVVYPQVGPVQPPGGVDVAVLSCTLPVDLAGLCGAIEDDFLVRQAPAYRGSVG